MNPLCWLYTLAFIGKISLLIKGRNHDELKARIWEVYLNRD